MNKKSIDVSALALQPFNTLGSEGVLLVSGSSVTQCNLMTISWGLFGIMWGKPIVMVLVRPTRYTWGFISKAPDFTVNWMSREHAAALALCGTKSGRQMNKFAAAKLHPVVGQTVVSPVIEESILSLECRVVYTDILKPGNCLAPEILECYPNKDFHGLFYGEIVTAVGTTEFEIPRKK